MIVVIPTDRLEIKSSNNEVITLRSSAKALEVLSECFDHKIPRINETYLAIPTRPEVFD